MICAYCVVDTAGLHSADCPFSKQVIADISPSGTGCLPSLEEIAKEAEELLTQAFKPIGEFLKEHNDRIEELEQALKKIAANDSCTVGAAMANVKTAKQVLAKKHEGG